MGRTCRYVVKRGAFHFRIIHFSKSFSAHAGAVDHDCKHRSVLLYATLTWSLTVTLKVSFPKRMLASSKLCHGLKVLRESIFLICLQKHWACESLIAAFLFRFLMKAPTPRWRPSFVSMRTRYEAICDHHDSRYELRFCNFLSFQLFWKWLSELTGNSAPHHMLLGQSSSSPSSSSPVCGRNLCSISPAYGYIVRHCLLHMAVEREEGSSWVHCYFIFFQVMSSYEHSPRDLISHPTLFHWFFCCSSISDDLYMTQTIFSVANDCFCRACLLFIHLWLQPWPLRISQRSFWLFPAGTLNSNPFSMLILLLVLFEKCWWWRWWLRWWW